MSTCHILKHSSSGNRSLIVISHFQVSKIRVTIVIIVFSKEEQNSENNKFYNIRERFVFITVIENTIPAVYTIKEPIIGSNC